MEMVKTMEKAADVQEKNNDQRANNNPLRSGKKEGGNLPDMRRQTENMTCS